MSLKISEVRTETIGMGHPHTKEIIRCVHVPTGLVVDFGDYENQIQGLCVALKLLDVKVTEFDRDVCCRKEICGHAR